jgi:CNT family concentrative nucleoside transporter
VTDTTASVLPNLHSLFGWFALAALAWAAGGARRPTDWRPLIGGSALVFSLATLVFAVPATRGVLVTVNDGVVAVLQAGLAGATFLFGPLALSPGQETVAGEPSIGFVLATQVLPAVVFFSALTALLYHLRVIQPVVQLFARVFRRTLGLSGAEAMGGAANLFVGIEAGLTVRPFIARMTRSELFLLLTCSMATVASTTLAIYVFLLADIFPLIAGHLLSASLLSVPTAAIVAKLMVPETQCPATSEGLPGPSITENDPSRPWLTVLAEGGEAGIRLAAGIAALLIAVLGLVAILDLALAWVSDVVPHAVGIGQLSVERLLGWLFTPLAWCLGVEASDVGDAARLLGRRAVLTEIVAYQDLSKLAATGAVNARSLLILSYAICGFSHVASIGVFVGGLSAMAPERATTLAVLGPRALVASTFATLMTGALAGAFWRADAGMLGL